MAASGSSRELDVGVVEDGVDFELAAECFDVALQGGEAHVEFLLDAPDVRARGAEGLGELGLAGAARFAASRGDLPVRRA